VAFVADQLLSTVEPELAALDDPASADAVIGRLEDAKQRAEQLRSQSAKWQQTLNDGAQDLTSDLDHDLRQRFRAIVAESDAVFDEQDPSTCGTTSSSGCTDGSASTSPPTTS
jgi:septum formation inhibitor-activating ATPase MinD